MRSFSLRLSIACHAGHFSLKTAQAQAQALRELKTMAERGASLQQLTAAIFEAVKQSEELFLTIPPAYARDMEKMYGNIVGKAIDPDGPVF